MYTIGHSNHPIELLLDLLARYDVAVVADVRSVPHSRFAPQHNRRALTDALEAAGVRYAYFGDELGGRPREPELRDEAGHVRYDLVAATRRFQAGIDRLIEVAATRRVAVMCSEVDPAHCHRRLLVGRALQARGVEVRHIRKDGTLATEADLDPAPTLF